MTWADELKFVVAPEVKKGEAVCIGRTYFVHAYDYLLQVGKGRLPFESSMNLGMRELERDRRRNRP